MKRGRAGILSRVLKALLAVAAAAAVTWGAFVQGMPPEVTEATKGFGTETAPEAIATESLLLDDWGPERAPNYYECVGSAVEDLHLAPGEVYYQGLDSLGRTGRVAACVTHQMMQDGIARDREDMSGIDPSGWGHNEKVAITTPDGHVYHGFFYNRSHLLAKSLGGADILENVITGTRMQNVGGGGGGMACAESLARTWLDEHPSGVVWYSATPVYHGTELVPRWVVVDVLSSDGAVDQRFVVYNTAKDYDIDYATGEFRHL